MAASKSASIVQASLWIIGTDMVVVPLSELFNRLLNASGYGKTNKLITKLVDEGFSYETTHQKKSKAISN